MRFMNSNYQDPRNFSQAPQQPAQQSPSLQQAIEMMRGGNVFGAHSMLQSLVGLPQRDYGNLGNVFAQPAPNLGMGNSNPYSGQATSFQPPQQYTQPAGGLLGPPNPYAQKPVNTYQAPKQYAPTQPKKQAQFGQYGSTL